MLKTADSTPYIYQPKGLLALEMEISCLRHSPCLAKSPEIDPKLCSVIDDFFAENHYQIHQFNRGTKELKPLVLPEDYSKEQGTAEMQPSEQVFLWESLTTQKSISVSGDSSGEEISESGIVESRTYKEVEVQTSAQWISPANQQSKHFFLFKCTDCRLRCMDNRLRRCLPCGYWLCGLCEDKHPITHSILYYRTEEQLRKDHC